ncbi:NAD(P)/FAD-dependent oxidoreductase [Lachnospiraceae bacterium LCP25S3_G4]
MSKVLVVGGGAAGMFAAIVAAREGNTVHLIEKNEKLGKKLFITGKGRCNITNAGDMENLFASVMSNSKFLYSSFYGFSNTQIIDFFNEIGVQTKIERGNRVFPTSDHSSDVINALIKEMKRLDIQVHYCATVRKIIIEGERFKKVELNNHSFIEGDACIIATGGNSYQTTGSTGDGYQFARDLGHKVTDIYPALVPLEIKEPYIKELQGLALKNVQTTIYDGKKAVYSDFGEMLFTHFGVSGPLILSGSSYIVKKLKGKEMKLIIDLKPALSTEQLDHRIVRDFEENANKQFKNAITKLFPTKLIPIMLLLSGIDSEKKVHDISKKERQGFVNIIKNMELTIVGTRGYNEAIITKGGVVTKEIHPATMESKKVTGVYFIGEVLDLDALTGGYNLQIAWSTAYAAGMAIGKKEREYGI